ncbi:hypothetical protein F4677DRAFT_3328 [Hypoxylon crocopeplum]|nr:hypothetical protein F4677DRAFT_3328 [Hypoxylon crocopeplum]
MSESQAYQRGHHRKPWELVTGDGVRQACMAARLVQSIGRPGLCKEDDIQGHAPTLTVPPFTSDHRLVKFLYIPLGLGVHSRARNMESLAEANLRRIRENQRRSRARRKEYIQELEKRLKLCHSQGVEATLEVQHAARRVAEDSKKMRVLLNSLGFDNDRLNYFLRTGNLGLDGSVTLDHSDDQDDLAQTLGSLLEQPRQSAHLDYKSHTNSSAPDNVTVYSTMGSSFIESSKHNRAELDSLATGTDRTPHLSSSPPLTELNNLELETQEYTSGLITNPPLGIAQQLPASLPVEPYDKPRPFHTSLHGTDSNLSNNLYYGHGADSVQQHLEGGLMVDLYSSLPSTSKQTSYPISAETMFSNPPCQDREHYNDVYNAQHMPSLALAAGNDGKNSVGSI